MYYSHRCSYCNRLFSTHDSNRWRAASDLYNAIKKHLVDYDEDHKEYKFDDGPKIDTEEVYKAMVESNEKPPGAYEI